MPIDSDRIVTAIHDIIKLTSDDAEELLKMLPAEDKIRAEEAAAKMGGWESLDGDELVESLVSYAKGANDPNEQALIIAFTAMAKMKGVL